MNARAVSRDDELLRQYEIKIAEAFSATEWLASPQEKKPMSNNPPNEPNVDDCQYEASELTAEKIINVVSQNNSEFFRNQFGELFAWIPVTVGTDTHFECVALGSNDFLSRLMALVVSKTGAKPKPAELKKARRILELESLRSKKQSLNNRTAFDENQIYVDLGDDQWKMIVLNKDDWKTTAHDSPRFFRVRHHKSLAPPIPGGSTNDLFDYIPVRDNDEKLLLITWILAALHPGIPSPILLVVGPQGSGKTSRSRRIRNLLDPSEIDTLGDLDVKQLFQTFHHHAVPCFENVSHFNRVTADMFCRAVTGNGVERRKLFTDSDQVIYAFRRSIIINGISTPSTRPDFLDRCLVLHCDRLQEFRRQQDLDAEFDQKRPHLLGALLDLLVKTLGNTESPQCVGEFRMADFASFGRSVAIALGHNPADFDNAYRENIRQQTNDLVEDCLLMKLILLVAQSFPFESPLVCTAERLLRKLWNQAKDAKFACMKKDLPQSPRWLSTRLGEVAPLLAQQDVILEKLPRSSNARKWKLSLAPSAPTVDPQKLEQAAQGRTENE